MRSLSARVELQPPGNAFPERLWFKIPKKFREYVTGRTDCFAVSLLPVSMISGEDLEIRGELSSRLAYGLQEYERIQHLWKPDIFKPIGIKFRNLSLIHPAEKSEGVGCTFSGGVDSFYTLWSHLPQNEQNPAYRLSHCVMINGFDFNSTLDDRDIFSIQTRQFYEPMMKELGLELIIIRTNLHQFLEKYPWPDFMYMFGSSLIASALAFGNLFNKFYIASSFHYTQLFPWGSHPLLDPMLSTETTEILHDGAHLTRTEKIVALSQWPVTYSRLHPCLFDTSFVKRTSRVENCCLCERCVPTMGLLEALGVLEKYTVFHKPLTQRNMRNVPFFDIPEKGDRKYLYTREAIDFAGKMGRNDIARNLLYGIIRHKCLMHPEKKARHFIKEMLKEYSMTNSKE